MSKRMKILFTLSILLNLILVGLVGGGAIHKYNSFHRHMESKFGHLSPELKEKLKASFAASHDEIKASIKEGRAAKKQLKEAMNSEEFNEQLYDEASKKLNDLRYKMMQHKAAKTKALVKDLSADERRQMLGYLLRGGMDGFHSGFKRGGKSKFLTAKDRMPPPPPNSLDPKDVVRSPPAVLNEENTVEGDDILTPIPE